MFKFTDVTSQTLSDVADFFLSYNGLYHLQYPVVISYYPPFPSKYFIHYYSFHCFKMHIP